jgi:chromosomal replication initiator protein
MIRPDAIQDATARYFGVEPRELTCALRDAEYVRPRHIAMFLMRRLSGYSYPAIGRHFGWRDHTTVLYAVRKIDRLYDNDPVIHSAVNDIWAKLDCDNPETTERGKWR